MLNLHKACIGRPAAGMAQYSRAVKGPPDPGGPTPLQLGENIDLNQEGKIVLHRNIKT